MALPEYTNASAFKGLIDSGLVGGGDTIAEDALHSHLPSVIQITKIQHLRRRLEPLDVDFNAMLTLDDSSRGNVEEKAFRHPFEGSGVKV